LPVSYDLNIEARLKEFLILALSYRNDRSISNIVQFMLLPQLKLGYAYDFAFGSNKGRDFNSHEIMLNYIFKYDIQKVSNGR
jgi:hypothetical protein